MLPSNCISVNIRGQKVKVIPVPAENYVYGQAGMTQAGTSPYLKKTV